MTARVIGALTRASWHQAKSYRVSLLMQVFGLVLTVLPLYFITQALQPTMAGAISREAEQYFGFVLVGSIAFMFVTTSMSTLPGTIAGGISTGYFESLLMTRASLPSILAGLSSYGLLLTAVRATVMIVSGWFLGAHVVWSQSLPAALIILLLVVTHWGIGMVASALVIAFRTAGPLTTIFSTLSIFFGGVYFPVDKIPSWLGAISKGLPLAYGLESLRRVWLQGEGLSAVGTDLAVLAAMAVLALAVGTIAIDMSLRYARRAGTLSTY
jgi:ABC-2 type transport system permease protein